MALLVFGRGMSGDSRFRLASGAKQDVGISKTYRMVYDAMDSMAVQMSNSITRDTTPRQAATAAQRAESRFPPVAGSDAALVRASKQRAKSILQSLDDGHIRRACNEGGLGDSDFLKVFHGIAEAWNLTNAQRGALLDVSARTYQRWRSRTPKLTDEQVLRISYYVNLYLDLQTIENDSSTANAWVRNANLAFGDCAPIEVMTQGTLIDVFNVYSYVHRVATL